ncbi:uncharacterized protein yc1106_07300 [Curvularia clavata]|uniref:DNA (cytosine-5-)-methyltransferase n=1 Tax=Curvularia clavata TaxID=95742 RepID=A0A9Q8ZD79_CURCL|nr:uncharacterized protein yc1106_07300 [Curvularia clavata]
MTEPKHASSRSSHDFAHSNAVDWAPPISITPELEAHCRLKVEWRRHSHNLPANHAPKKEPLVADIHHFEIYSHPHDKYRAHELTCLHFLGGPRGKKLCFDGFMYLGSVQCYMQGITLQDIRIDTKDPEDAKSHNITVYVQSELASKGGTHDIWYRLNEPTPRYQRFHEAFLWVGQLGRHVIDYMSKASRSLICFRSNFHSYLAERFGGNPDFERWHTAFQKKTDFRVAIVAYINYFFTRAQHDPNSDRLVNQPVWTECMARSVTPPLQSISHAPTLATPAVYACFKDTYFGDKIREIRPKRKVKVEQERRKEKLGFAEIPASLTYAELSENCKPYGTSQVMVGDIVVLVPDETDSRTWKHTKRDWLAYVQGTETLDNGIQRLFVLWLYWPHDTNIAKAFYPFENELFLSDNCNCSDRMLFLSDIKGKYSVDWCPSVVNARHLFVRQKYVTEESSFVTIKEEHKTCHCRTEKNRQPTDIEYHPGDTVYMKPSNNHGLLEPVVIWNVDEGHGSIWVLKLLRLSRDCSEMAEKAQRSRIADNELVLTDFYYKTDISQLRHRCYIRFVSKTDVANDHIPFPYNLGGAGDFWFISMGLNLKNEKALVFLRSLPEDIHQRLTFESDRKLKGLSLFGGGGLLDRGLEEGGAVEFRTVVDSNVYAIRTQQANIKCRKKVCLYCGSVNDFLDSALKGDVEVVAEVGEVEFIAAGCPCIAFSALQLNTKSIKSLYNASLISSFCSSVDLYRPLYAVLENVLEISSEKTDYLLCQVVASLVSMGYQVKQFIMDSWSYGSPQHRSRLILTIAAPGLHPILQQRHTHSLPDKDFASRSLGRLPNGLPYGMRESYATPLRHVPAGTVSSGLPDIENSLVQACIPYPDHRVVKLPTWKERALLECIPRDPSGCGYQEAMDRGLVPLHLRNNRKKTDKSFRRIKKDGLVPTITTEANAANAIGSPVVHWEEPRSISLLEARRAQGIGDDEPIIGPLREQYKIAGNGVDRKVGFSIGLGLLYAQEKNELQFTPTDTAERFHATANDDGHAECIPVYDEEKINTVPSDRSDLFIPVPATSQASRKRTSSFIIPDCSPSPTKTEEPNAQTKEERPRSDERLRKIAKVSKASETARNSEHVASSPIPSKDSTQSSVNSKRTRYTRHSGLKVEFVPEHWNKRVEVAYRNSKL